MRFCLKALTFVTFGLLQLATQPVNAAVITNARITAWADYLNRVDGSPSFCSATSSGPFGASLTGDDLVCDKTPNNYFPPSLWAWANVDSFGGAFGGTGCEGYGGDDSTAFSYSCTHEMSVEGDYFFAGSGKASFDFGSFTYFHIAITTLTLSIDGHPYIAHGSVPIVDLQLGAWHHVSFMFEGDPDMNDHWGSFDFGANTPASIGPFLTATPEPGSFWLAAVPLLVLLRRRVGIGGK